MAADYVVAVRGDLGTGPGDRLEASRAAPGAFEEGVQLVGRHAPIAGKSRREANFRALAVAGRNLHGKEGVDGSSPSEGSAKAAEIAAFSVG